MTREYFPTLEVPYGQMSASGQASSLYSKLSKARNDKRPESLKEATEEFEALFLAYILKVMRESISKSELFSEGLGDEIYAELMDQELARKLAKANGLGLGELVFKALSQRESRAEVEPDWPSQPMIRDEPPAGEQGSQFAIPVKGDVSSSYGWRIDPFTGQMRFHQGIDIAAEAGSPVYAAASGRVVWSGWKQRYGYMVEIEHGNGYRTRYAHLQDYSVRIGQPVTQGQAIGRVGSSGRATGPHLHLEIYKQNMAVNPKSLLQLEGEADPL